ncbi:uncharacterized protein BO66DRAFT_440592 [Aspergillus aculeatinus CBS 121060]|uniref:Uncharacterized protein n=1 Tax=Aspergillus aculeatinus CBS 121060 TaxID=1448322 RepID=A0ACD1H2Y0_9EURO|nr:hypothetical protein BO66DRAFT_440592 [Aspergillus aculeatinus CBS 121060]RAH67933.1 hypothetical protein BO66DRAFT_440592 [Aspergillus aculeatinus CBS 121060]
MSQPTTAILPQLPNKLHLHYASYLNGQSIVRLSKTCKALRAVFRDEAQRIIKHVEADALTYDHYWNGVRLPEDHPDIISWFRFQRSTGPERFAYEPLGRYGHRQRLEDAVRKGNGEEIQRFLEAGLMPTVWSRGLYGPLLHGVIKCRKAFKEPIRTVFLLLEVGARPNVLDDYRHTALDAGATFDPSPADGALLELILAYGGKASRFPVLATLYRAAIVHRNYDGNGLEHGSRLVRKAIANGTNVVRAVGPAFKNLLRLGGGGNREEFSTEQVCDLVGLVPELLDLVDKGGETAMDYIMKDRPAVAWSLEQTKHPRIGKIRDTWITRQGGKRYCQILNAPELWEYLESLEAIEPDLQSLQEEAVQLSFDDIMKYHPAVALYMEVINHPRIDDLANTWIMERGREIYQEALNSPLFVSAEVYILLEKLAATWLLE